MSWRKYELRNQRQELDDFKRDYLDKGFTYDGQLLVEGTGNGPMTVCLKKPDRSGAVSVRIKYKGNFDQVRKLLFEPPQS